jgi:pilus assembly protein Flp/PilA
MIFIHDQDGATAIEYGLIVASIAVTILVALNSVGLEVSDLYEHVGTRVVEALS